MLNPKITEAFQKLTDSNELIEIDIKGIRFSLGIPTVGENLLLKNRFAKLEEPPDSDEVMIEQIMFAIRKVDDAEIRLFELDEESRDKMREILAGIPRNYLRLMHTKLMFAELEADAEAGLQQLRQILLSTGFLQLAPMVPFPITIKELAEALATSSSMDETLEKLSALEGKYVEAISLKKEEESETSVTTEEEFHGEEKDISSEITEDTPQEESNEIPQEDLRSRESVASEKSNAVYVPPEEIENKKEDKKVVSREENLVNKLKTK